MTDDTFESPATLHAEKEPEDEITLVEDLRALIDETFDLAQAEIAFQKSRAKYLGSQVRALVAIALIAAILAFFAGIALVVGLVVALTPLITAWGATAVVAGGLLVITALCGLSIKSRARTLLNTLGQGGDD